jgi:hypothetical protein
MFCKHTAESDFDSMFHDDFFNALATLKGHSWQEGFCVLCLIMLDAFVLQ